MLFRWLVLPRSVLVPLHRIPRCLHHLVQCALHATIYRNGHKRLPVVIVAAHAKLRDRNITDFEFQLHALASRYTVSLNRYATRRCPEAKLGRRVITT